MKRLVDVIQSSTGWSARIDESAKGEGAASPLRDATDEALFWAASYWPQADPDDFEWELGGMKVRHKPSGETFKIRLGWPVTGEVQSDIACFTVRDSKLILLGKPGSARPATTYLGTFHSYGAVKTDGGPTEGDRLRIL